MEAAMSWWRNGKQEGAHHLRVRAPQGVVEESDSEIHGAEGRQRCALSIRDVDSIPNEQS
jgi:hypothetical protein